QQSIGRLVPDFARDAAAARSDLAPIMQDASSPLADDAAFWSGWLAYHMGQEDEALKCFDRAIGYHGDYARRAATYALWILKKLPPQQFLQRVTTDTGLRTAPLLRYFAIRRTYQAFDYAQAIAQSQAALIDLKVPLARLPATTDPNRIWDAL